MIFNNPESENTYMVEKYGSWYKRGFHSEQDSDPTIPPCSYCRKRTNELKLFTNDGVDYLVCDKHNDYGQEN